MEQQVKRERLVVASFFFHGPGVPIQKSVLGLFRSLLHQILQKIPKLCKEFDILYQDKCYTEGKIGKTWNWHERNLKDFFKTHITDIPETHSIRIYVNTLDKCEEMTATNLIDFFSLITAKVASTKISISIYFSYQHYPVMTLKHGLAVCTEDENRTDIKKYLKESFRNVCF